MWNITAFFLDGSFGIYIVDLIDHKPHVLIGYKTKGETPYPYITIPYDSVKRIIVDGV